MPVGSVQQLLRTMVREDPGRPRLTWYGPGGERVELSARTLQNWVAKTANLLVELEAGPGTTIGVDLPVHWRGVVWLLGSWAVGAHAVVPPGALLDDQVDVVVTPHVAAPPTVRAGVLVIAALPALASRYDGDLPPGAVDAATEVRLQPDDFVAGHVRPEEGTPALTVPGDGGHPLTLSYAQLLSPVADPDPGTAGRLLTDAGPERAAEAWLAPLLAGGSVVLHHDLASLEVAERDHLAAQEGVTAVLTSG